MYLKCLNQDIEQRINMQTATSDYLQWKLSQRKEKRNQLNKESQNLILEHAELKFDPNKTITRYWRCNALSFRVTATFVFFSTGLNCSRLRRIGNIFIASSKCSGFSFSWAVNYDFDFHVRGKISAFCNICLCYANHDDSVWCELFFLILGDGLCVWVQHYFHSQIGFCNCTSNLGVSS